MASSGLPERARTNSKNAVSTIVVAAPKATKTTVQGCSGRIRINSAKPAPASATMTTRYASDSHVLLFSLRTFATRPASSASVRNSFVIVVIGVFHMVFSFRSSEPVLRIPLSGLSRMLFLVESRIKSPAAGLEVDLADEFAALVAVHAHVFPLDAQGILIIDMV